MRALDSYNERARQLALKQSPPSPYSAKVIDYERRCPHCDEALRRRQDQHGFHTGMDDECQCSFWSYQMYPTGMWLRTEKSATINSNN